MVSFSIYIVTYIYPYFSSNISIYFQCVSHIFSICVPYFTCFSHIFPYVFSLKFSTKVSSLCCHFWSLRGGAGRKGPPSLLDLPINGLVLLGKSTPETIWFFPSKTKGFPVSIFPSSPGSADEPSGPTTRIVTAGAEFWLVYACQSWETWEGFWSNSKESIKLSWLVLWNIFYFSIFWE